MSRPANSGAGLLLSAAAAYLAFPVPRHEVAVRTSAYRQPSRSHLRNWQASRLQVPAACIRHVFLPATASARWSSRHIADWPGRTAAQARRSWRQQPLRPQFNRSLGFRTSRWATRPGLVQRQPIRHSRTTQPGARGRAGGQVRTTLVTPSPGREGGPGPARIPGCR